MGSNLRVSSSPHIRSDESVTQIMRDVTIALLPAALFGVYNFGMNALINLVLAVVSAVVFEAMCQKLMHRPVTVSDFSAIVTGLLLGMNLPPDVPFWMPVVGSAFAIIIVKQAFGGLGHNFMNPAMASRVFLLIAWTGPMTTWTASQRAVDSVSSATPLGIIAEGGSMADMPSIMSAFIGTISGSIGETSALLLLIGGLYLLWKKIIDIKIPGIIFLSVAVTALLVSGFDVNYMLYNLASGGLFLGAIFMATDYASSPVSSKAQIIYAVGIGVLTVIIRKFGAYPEGVSFAIILMNVCTPLLDKYTRPRVFGTGGAK